MKKHGMCYTRLNVIWRGMKQRCNDLNASNYYKYGAKGIEVCEEWNEFLPFYKWAIKNGYRDDLSIDRIDSIGSYEPSNCRWATTTEQANNKRNNINITYKGETHTLIQWSNIMEIGYAKLWNRIRKLNWNVEKAFSKK